MSKKGSHLQKDRIFGSEYYSPEIPGNQQYDDNYADEDMDSEAQANQEISSDDYDDRNIGGPYGHGATSYPGGSKYNYNPTAYSQPKKPAMSKYDVNSTNYRMGAVSMASASNNKMQLGYSLDKKGMGTSTHTDIYSNINIGNYGMSSNNDKYNINIDPSKFQNEKKTENPFDFFKDKSKEKDNKEKENDKFQENREKKKKPKQNFFDQLENELEKDAKKNNLEEDDDYEDNSNEYEENFQQKEDPKIKKKDFFGQFEDKFNLDQDEGKEGGDKKSNEKDKSPNIEKDSHDSEEEMKGDKEKIKKEKEKEKSREQKKNGGERDKEKESANINKDKGREMVKQREKDKEREVENEKQREKEKMNQDMPDLGTEKENDSNEESSNNLSEIKELTAKPNELHVYSADLMEEYLKKTQGEINFRMGDNKQIKDKDIAADNGKEKFKKSNSSDEELVSNDYAKSGAKKENSIPDKDEEEVNYKEFKESEREDQENIPSEYINSGKEHKNNNQSEEDNYEDKFEEVESQTESNYDILKFNKGMGTSQSSELMRSEREKRIESDIATKQGIKSEAIKEEEKKEKAQNYVPVEKKIEVKVDKPVIESEAKEKNKLISPSVTQTANIVAKSSENLIKSLIVQEIGNYLSNLKLDSLMSLSSNNTPKQEVNFLQIGKPSTGISEAKDEHYKFLAIDKNSDFLIQSDQMIILFKKFDTKCLKTIHLEEVYISCSKPPIPNKDFNLIQMKLQKSLDEERKKREFYEVYYMRQQEMEEEKNTKLVRLKALETENAELKKQNMETEEKYKEMEKDIQLITKEYEHKIKLVEERVSLRESRSEGKKLAEVERNYENKIIDLKYEITTMTSELNDYKRKCEFLENENSKLSLNKIAHLETNEKIKDLRNENFILHEKCNEMMTNLQDLGIEKDKLEKRMLEKELKMEIPKREEIKPQEKGREKASITVCLVKPPQEEVIFANNIHSQNFFMPSELGTDNIFDQILIDREMNVQESIIKSYTKEIERLNNEIKFVKKISGESDNTKNGLIKNTKSSQEEKNLVCVKESAEEKIKILQKFINDLNNSGGISLSYLENEFIHSQDQESDYQSGEISLEGFLKIFEKIKVPLSKYEMIEIFNNYPKLSGGKNNKIRFSDFINSLRSKSPSNFFLQPDPSYLKELEARIVYYEKKIKELEKFIIFSAEEEEEHKKKITALESENTLLKEKVKEGSINENVLTNLIMKNNFTCANSAHTGHSDSMIVKLTEQLKNVEISHNNNLREFQNKIEKYEEKINSMQKVIADKANTQILSSNSINQQLASLTEENMLLKNKLTETEFLHKSQIEKYQVRLDKYKKNYYFLKEKNQILENEKQKIVAMLKDKNISPQTIVTFLSNLEEIQQLTAKINELERKNKDREEYYKQLCLNANSYQVNKELENVTKKFENEKREYLKMIHQKNLEIVTIRKEFEDLLKEIEHLRNSTKKIR